MRGDLWRQVAHAPRAVKPHVVAVHAQVEQVVQVLAARDGGVEAHLAEHAGAHAEAAAAHVVGAADARAAQRAVHPLVELQAFGPPAVLPPRARDGRVRGVVHVEVAAALRGDLQALARGEPHAVHGVNQEVLVQGNLVVVQEDHHVVVEHGRDGQPHVADGAVAAKRNGIALEPRHGPVDGRAYELGLRRAYDQRVQPGVLAADAIDPRTCALHACGVAHKEHHDPEHAAHRVERREAGLELGQRLRHGRRVVIYADLADLGGRVAFRPVGWYDDDGIQDRWAPSVPRAPQSAGGAGSDGLTAMLSYDTRR